MRSDFYGLPYAAQMAIRKGERNAHRARSAADEIARLNDEIERLNAIIAALNTDEERIRREAFEEAAKVADVREDECARNMRLPGLRFEDQRTWEQRRNEARVIANTIRKLISTPSKEVGR